MIGKIGGTPGTAPLKLPTAKLEQAVQQGLEAVSKLDTPKLGTDQLKPNDLSQSDPWAEIAEGDFDDFESFDNPGLTTVAARMRQTSVGGGELI